MFDQERLHKSRIQTTPALDSNNMSRGNTEVAIVGGGLVGALEACYLGSHGYKVNLYEYRKDIREMEHIQGRSINLALSVRGREALRKVGLEDEVLMRLGTPMYARMIHNIDGTLNEIPYGQRHECIYSVSRRILNEILLTDENLKPFCFQPSFEVFIDSENKAILLTILKSNGEETESKADLIVGCDGTFSAVRRAIMQAPGFNLNQTWIDHGYMELCMDPDSDGEYKMKENYLHIWPRGDFMMIALPNMDRSFTMTLFMPFYIFDELNSDEAVMQFFEKHFPDSIELIGKKKLLEDFENTKASRLIYIKGFEDCLLLNELLEEYNHDFTKVLPEYSRKRTVDAHAIADLALYNYLEMRDHVNSLSFILRKKVDNLIYKVCPSKWIPLYSMVTFSRMRYSECVENRKWQDKVILNAKRLIQATLVTSLLGFTIWKYNDIKALVPQTENIHAYLSNVLSKLS
ncbi:Kynurenine 3-monooxygenase [Nymphon striatum]|nr:Kynurenine 3-monooxygenase [Nymphon striatum]